MSVVYIVQMSQLFLLILSKEASFIIRWLMDAFSAYVPGKW